MHSGNYESESASHRFAPVYTALPYMGRQTNRQKDSQTDTHIPTHKTTQALRQAGLQTERPEKHVSRQSNRHTYRQTDVHADRQADRQTDRQADRQTDRQTGGAACWLCHHLCVTLLLRSEESVLSSLPGSPPLRRVSSSLCHRRCPAKYCVPERRAAGCVSWAFVGTHPQKQIELTGQLKPVYSDQYGHFQKIE
jgi:hypothetical protein